MPVLERDAAKAYLNITSGAHDDVLQGFIDAAIAAIAAKVGPLEPTSISETVSSAGWPVVLRRPPAISLTSIVSGVTTADLDGITLDGPTGVVTGIPSGTWTVTYMAGREDLPGDLLLAVKEQLRHLWTTQRGPTKRPGSSPSEMTANTIPGAAYMMPFRVSELIAPHLYPGIA